MPQGTYCSLYDRPYDKSFSTNYGEYQGGVYYGVSSSYSFTLNPQDTGRTLNGKSGSKSQESDD